MLLLNLLVVGGVQTALFVVQQEWYRRQLGDTVARSVVPFLLDTYTAERLTGVARVRELVQSGVIRQFDDVVVTSGRSPRYGFVVLNPLGAVHRDPDLFPREAIENGMVQSGVEERLVPVGDGYCTAVLADGRVVGTLWFDPRNPEETPPAVSLWISVLAVLVGTSLFGALLYGLVVRTIGRPLVRIGAAAAQVGAGAYGARLPELRAVPELEALVRSFNSMAEKVEGHTGELQQAVDRAVAEAKQKERALVQSSRLAAVGTLAAGIAHEINNPIGGMLNAVHRLLQNDQLTERQRTYLTLVQDGLQRIAGTARKVLDFSPKPVQARPFPLRQAVDGARALLEHRLQRQRVDLAVDLAPDLPPVVGDVREIQQVLLNLLLNSLDALGSRGDAGHGDAGAGSGGHVRVQARLLGGKVQVVVEDDGPGMDPADLPRVMDPFFSKKDRPDASGLGMFISFSIVRNHGGEMTVDSAPGQGFRTVLTLPLADPAPQRQH